MNAVHNVSAVETAPVSPPSPPAPAQPADVLRGIADRLIASAEPGGYWDGELSGSALSTAVAITALTQVDKEAHQLTIRKGLHWLSANINPDGGWGDSPGSESNLSTTLLSWSALSLAGKGDYHYSQALRRAETRLTEYMGGLNPETIASSVLSYYGNDRTFSAPILTMCAVCGVLGAEDQRWRLVPQLPMELAAFPHAFFKWLRLPVVSYAIPALIAIGLIKHIHSPSRLKVARFLRSRVTHRVLDKLEAIQPEHGGYLEASPLTGFVVMSMASSGYRDHTVTSRGVNFLLDSQRNDGCWPIDTHLSTWVTTLAVNALSIGEADGPPLPSEQREKLLQWLLDQQFQTEHVFTHAAPGGWSWTPLPGGVPDADDTAGALLALHHLGKNDLRVREAAEKGIIWLLDLRNRDGGIPTFCKGWGKLPFDRSCPDITAHALRAWAVWLPHTSGKLQRRIERAVTKGIRYLAAVRRDDGAWVPLWFGNQWRQRKENPIYGTSRVVTALKHEHLRSRPGVNELLEKACRWMTDQQNSDGGWGSDSEGNSTIEETAIVIEALAGHADSDVLTHGLNRLSQLTGRDVREQRDLPASPIGLYFANLWYYEKLYPVVFTIAALKETQCINQSGQKQSKKNATKTPRPQGTQRFFNKSFFLGVLVSWWLINIAGKCQHLIGL